MRQSEQLLRSNHSGTAAAWLDPGHGRRGKADATRVRVVEAAIETLKREGYAGTSARAVARTGGFAQGVVFYHFGGMTELLLAALEETSRVRLASYESAVADSPLAARARRRRRRGLSRGPRGRAREGAVGAHRRRREHPGPGRRDRDRASGRGSTSSRPLSARVTLDSPIAQLVPPREAAFSDHHALPRTRTAHRARR